MVITLWWLIDTKADYQTKIMMSHKYERFVVIKIKKSDKTSPLMAGFGPINLLLEASFLNRLHVFLFYLMWKT